MPEEFKKRQTAYKVSIGMLINNIDKIYFDENNRFKFLNLGGKEIYRINLIANIIDKFESNQKQYINVTLDDGTGNIRVKAFADSIDLLKDLQIGDSVIVVGILRFYGDELYIMPEIIKSVDPKWLVARKLELEKEYGELYSSTKDYAGFGSPDKPEKKEDFIEDQKPSEVEYEKISRKNNIEEEQSLRKRILEIIRNAEIEGGIDIDNLILSMKESVENINKEITSLLEEGMIYEPKPGRLRIL